MVVIMPQKCSCRVAGKFSTMALLWHWQKKTKKHLVNCHHFPLPHLPCTFLTDPKEQAGHTGQDVKGISNTWTCFSTYREWKDATPLQSHRDGSYPYCGLQEMRCPCTAHNQAQGWQPALISQAVPVWKFSQLGDTLGKAPTSYNIPFIVLTVN